MLFTQTRNVISRFHSSLPDPNPVSDLAQVGCSTGNITVNWIQSDAKTGYSYQVNVTYLNGTVVKQQSVTATTATIVDLQSGVEYSVFVTTKSAGGTQAPAHSITAFTSECGIYYCHHLQYLYCNARIWFHG